GGHASPVCLPSHCSLVTCVGRAITQLPPTIVAPAHHLPIIGDAARMTRKVVATRRDQFELSVRRNSCWNVPVLSRTVANLPKPICSPTVDRPVRRDAARVVIPRGY